MFIKKLNFAAIAAIFVLLLTLGAGALKLYIDYAKKPVTAQRAEAGFAAGEKVITALENFRNAKGKYPQNLNELVPEYMEKNPQKDEQGEFKFTYFPEPQKDSFRLRLSYGTYYGVDDCDYSPGKKDWFCGGKS